MDNSTPAAAETVDAVVVVYGLGLCLKPFNNGSYPNLSLLSLTQQI